MPQPAPAPGCICITDDETPRTLSAQRKAGPVVQVDGDLETLALLGTQLSDALISTNNGAALLIGRGGYAPLQTTAHPFRISRNRVSMRVAPQTPLLLYRTKLNRGPCLLAATASGDIVHRITPGSEYDGQIIDALEPRASGTPIPDKVDLGQNIVSLTAVRNARAHWECSDTGQHLNDILDDGGMMRAQTLPHVGRNNAWRVLPNVLPSFISYLSDKQIGHARLVCGVGYFQGDLVRGGQVSQVGQIVLARSDARHFALDMAQVAQVWITRFGPVSQVELYDQDSRTIAVLAADPMSNFRDWNTLLASLPQPSRGLR